MPQNFYIHCKIASLKKVRSGVSYFFVRFFAAPSPRNSFTLTDIVDCITYVDYNGQDLCDIIQKHLPDKHHAQPSVHHPDIIPKPATVQTPLLLPPVHAPGYIPAGPQSNLAYNPSYNALN